MTIYVCLDGLEAHPIFNIFIFILLFGDMESWISFSLPHLKCLDYIFYIGRVGKSVVHIDKLLRDKSIWGIKIEYINIYNITLGWTLYQRHKTWDMAPRASMLVDFFNFFINFKVKNWLDRVILNYHPPNLNSV